MARICIDTTFLSPLIRDQPRALEQVRRWRHRGDDLATTELNRFEALLGVLLEDPGKRREGYLARLEAVLSAIETLPLSREAFTAAAHRQAELYRKGEPSGVVDLLIAAAAQVGGCDSIATGNAADFRRIGLLPVQPL